MKVDRVRVIQTVRIDGKELGPSIDVSGRAVRLSSPAASR